MSRGSSFLVAAVVSLSALAASHCAASSGSSENAATLGSDLIGGAPTDPTGSSALYIKAGRQECSAVMIGAHEILTAAHCVVPLDRDAGKITNFVMPAYAPGSPIRITNSSDVTDAGNWFETTVYATHLNPDFASDCLLDCDYTMSLNSPYPPDLAIITLNDPFPSCFGLPAAIGSAAVDDDVTETGYGCEVSVGLSNPYDSRFKTATATVLDPLATMASASSFYVADPAAFSQNYIITPGRNGAGAASLCPGDSGGPLFKGDFSNGGTVVGINAYYTFPKPDSGVSDTNVFARLDSPDTAAWIASVLKQSPSSSVTPPSRGEPINDGADPVASRFSISTVGIQTQGTVGCTGVILAPDAILTAAHCDWDESTTFLFYSSDSNGGAMAVESLPASAIESVDLPPAVDCDRTVTGSFPATCNAYVNQTFVYADLRVFHLNTTIPDGYAPVLLGPRESYADRYNDLSWEVATGGGGSMQWAPVSSVTTLDNDGSFKALTPFGLWGDSGGPLFQYAANGGDDEDDDDDGDGGDDDEGGTAKPNLVLMGIASQIGPPMCGQSDTAHVTRFTSVVSGDVFDWLVQEGGSPATPVSSFGAGQ